MGSKKYLIYLDILGFEELAQEIAGKSGFEEGWVRETLISKPVLSRVKEVSEIAIPLTSYSYLLMVDSVRRALEVVSELTAIKIPHKDYQFIPLELVLDALDTDEPVNLEPANRQATIKAIRKGTRTKETFVLFTPEFFDNLEPSDKRYGEPISYEGKNFFIANLEKLRQITQVSQFLKEIKGEGDERYKRIDEIYVPPLEYEDMANTLKEKRVLFITGTADYGKTYTTIRLMWEYYRKGYKPSWIKGGEQSERTDVRRRLENITAELKPKHIIYFEDPFGKTRYERRETLEREIGTIIDNIGRVEDVCVIITSREEVFKEFERECLSSRELEAFKRTLNIKTPSYDYEKRQQILLRWAEEEACKWLEKEELKEFILGLMKDKGVLPTPFSIRKFTAHSAGVEEKANLREEIEKWSEETARAFATEIKGMNDDKLLFLSFPFISDNFEVPFVNEIYRELLKELNFKDAWEFDRVLDWFKGDIVSISRERIEFSHPSYSEALKYLLVEAGYRTRLNEHIFSKLLLKLSDDGKAVRGVAQAVAGNFDKLPEDVKGLLFKLSEKDEAAGAVAWAVAGNFDKLPEDVKGLLFKLSEKDEAAWDVAQAIAGNFDKLPEDVKGLLFKLSEKDEAAGAVAWAVARNFDKLPEDARNLLFKLSEKDEAVGAVAQAILGNFDKLPEDVRGLLFKLPEKDEAAGAVAWAVAGNFDKLTEDVRDLLFNLSEKDEAAEAVAWAVAGNFDKLPEEVKGLLFKLSEKDEAAGAVAHAVARNFDKLPEDVRSLLFKLSEKGETAGAVAWAIARNFDKLPEDVRGLLFKLSERDESAGAVAWAIARNFDKLPEDVRSLLFKLSEKDKSAWDVAWAVVENFDQLPEELRGLLFKFSDKDEAAWGVAWAVAWGVAENFDKLPEVVRGLLDKLQEPLQHIIQDLSQGEDPRGKEYAIDLIYKALPKLNRDFVFHILQELSEDKAVEAKAKMTMQDILAE